MPHKKKKKANSFNVYVHEGVAYTPIHKNLEHAWVVPFDIKRKNVGGAVKKVSIDFFNSQKFAIFVSND